MNDIYYIDNMVKLQIEIGEESYYKLLKMKGTKRTWTKFLEDEVINE